MADDPFLGRTIADKYVVEALIGGGSMGAVYKARQTALHRVVAIKVMYPELAKDREFVARFRREAHAASRMAHTNSITITDFGEEPDGLLYLVMELVDGPSLEHLIESGEPLPEERVVDIMSQILSALAAAHDAGIVHRDLKPANVLVVQKFDDDGHPIDLVKVCDFGVASLKDHSEGAVRPSQEGMDAVGAAHADDSLRAATRPPMRKLTLAGAVVGTPAYMSPEQATGKPQDPRSDLYSLGVVMFEMLTRQLPFDGQTAEELMARHVAAPVPSPNDLVPCSPRLAEACVRAMQKRPDQRYANARAMRAEIRSASSLGTLGAPFSTYPASGAPESPVDSVRLPSTAPPLHADLASPSLSRRPDPAEPTATQGGVSSLPRHDRPESKRWPFAAAAALLGLGALVYAARDTTMVTVDATPAAASSSAELAHSGPLLPSSPASTDAAQVPASALPASSEPALPKVLPAPMGRAPRTAESAPRAPVASAAPVAVPVPAAGPPSPESAPPPVAVVPAPAAVAAPAPAYVADRARVHIAIASTSRIQKTALMSMVSRLDVAPCYRELLRRLGRPEGGAGTVRIDIDEDGLISTAQPAVPAVLGPSSSCIAAKIRGHRLSTPPDTGAAGAVLSLTFEP